MTILHSAAAAVKPAPFRLLSDFSSVGNILDIDGDAYDRWLAEADADADAEADMMTDAEADAMAARWADDELTDRIAHGAMPW